MSFAKQQTRNTKYLNSILEASCQGGTIEINLSTYKQLATVGQTTKKTYIKLVKCDQTIEKQNELRTK